METKTLEQARAAHPDSYIEIIDRAEDGTARPAIYVWPDEASAENDPGANVEEIYWLAQIANLDDLLDAMRADDPRTIGWHGGWRTDLPTFGGQAPASTEGVWSWDNDRVIIGTCSNDVKIVAREWLAE